MRGQPDILVLGGDGMLGHKIFQRLRASAVTVCTVRSDPPPRVDLLAGVDVIHGVDLMHLDRTAEWLAGLRPKFVINCAGIIKQRAQSGDAIPSFTINSLLPHCLAQWCARWNGRLIHFSTDCVFSGSRGGYREDDPSDAADLYGRSKFLGEVDALNALTLRTSIIGRELARHRSLLDWFLAQGFPRQNHGLVRGFRRVIYSGVTTNHLAELVERIVLRHPDLSGLYQVVSAPISKYDLLLAIRDAYRMDIEIAPDESEISDRSMRGDKLRAAIGYQAPPWPELIAQLAEDPTPYERWNDNATPGRQENPDYRWHRLAGQDAGQAPAHR
ncbi:MAG TPA: SDR family oxidoreductase [Bryobacteraceae bacterium]|nr:SDR family oxidoreductase [Bryobacteraceae bacterium]